MGSAELTFGLVHGGSHGAWCWERVVHELDMLGHVGVTMDLPCSDPEAGVETYASVVAEALVEIDGPVILVGHSLGGLTLPVVPELRPISRLIFLACILPVIGKSFQEQREEEPDIFVPPIGGRTNRRDRFYNDCAPEDAEWATNLLRVQALRPIDEVTPLKKWPDIPADYIICTDDRVCNPAWSRRAVPSRLGIAPVELNGADHSPFLSRPQELTNLLVQLAHSE